MGRHSKRNKLLKAYAIKGNEARWRHKRSDPLSLSNTETTSEGVRVSSASRNFIYLTPSTSTSSSKHSQQQPSYNYYYDEGEMESGMGSELDGQSDEDWKPEIKDESVSENEDELPNEEALSFTERTGCEQEGPAMNKSVAVKVKVKPSSSIDPFDTTLCLFCSGQTQLNFKTLSSDRDSLVMFIMMKMLEVPRETLQGYLTLVGHPRGWVTVCSQCQPLVSKAYDVQKMIIELEGKLRRFQDDMKDKVRDSFRKDQSKPEEEPVDKKTKWNKHSVRVTKDTWSHVANDKLPTKKVKTTHDPCSSITTTSSHPTSNAIPDNASTKSRRKQAIIPKDCDDLDFSPLTPEVDSYEDSIDVLKNKLPFVSSQPPAKRKKYLLETEGYRCVMCPNLGPMKSLSFTKHVSFHQERPFKCKDCDAYFTGSEIELDMRPKSINKKKDVNDEGHVCSKDSLIPVEFKCENIWECGNCSETFNSEEERNSHEQHGHQEEPKIELSHSCNECSKRFRSVPEWRLHRALEHPELSKYSCLHCDQIFKLETKEGIDLQDESAARIHINETHKESKKGHRKRIGNILSQCDICGENFTQALLLRAHFLEKHNLDERSTDLRHCPICFKRTPAHNWRIHLQFHRKGGKEKFICDICAYETVSSSLFQEHKVLKHGIEPEGRPPRECTVEDCAYRCVGKRTLEVHMMKEHGAERRLKCQHCGKGFLNKRHLLEHTRIHLNATTRPFQCEICGNSFALRNYLYIHKRLSHQNRPFASTHKKKPSRSKKVNRTPAASAAVPHKHEEMERHHFHSVHPAFNVEAIMKTDPQPTQE